VGGFERTRRRYGENERGERMKGGINREGSPDNGGYERYGKHPQSRGLSLPLSTSIAPAYDVANERGIFHIEESTQRQENHERLTYSLRRRHSAALDV